jgi:hypothetical protein
MGHVQISFMNAIDDKVGHLSEKLRARKSIHKGGTGLQDDRLAAKIKGQF